MERKLATIRKIKEINPIEGADAIELAVVDGWQVVVAKNVGHQVGDLVVYCEIDSFLPIEPEFEFLRKSSYKKMGDQEGFRLKTIKLRGQISQGLILPYSVIPIAQFATAADLPEGMDVSEMLGIVKYEPPIPAQLAGKVKGTFPSFLRKTDEERIQNLEKEYTEWTLSSKHQFYATEKLDGSSFTCYIKNGEFGVCSRNMDLLETEDNTFWAVARKLDLENKLRSFGKNICFQGEMVGSGIQGNHYNMKDQTVFFYNIFLIDEREYVGYDEFRNMLFDLDLACVPVLSYPFNFPADSVVALPTVSALLRSAEGKSVLNDKVEREGLVIRSMDRTISFKVISNKFLLGSKD
jgi:RNA ligase (TIGR02306 family)